MPKLASPRPFPYQSLNEPSRHSGIVKTSAVGVVTVDLGINHNNFLVDLTLQGTIVDLADAPCFTWAYGTKKGTFVLTCYKRPAAFGAWIADTVVRSFVFTAQVASVVVV